MTITDSAVRIEAVGSNHRVARLRWLRFSSPVVSLLILIQAIIAGRGLFIAFDEIELHGQIGLVTLSVVLLQTILAVRAWLADRSLRVLLALNALLLVLTAIQLSLGHAGRESSTAAAIHLPLGVFIFGTTIGITSTVIRTINERRVAQ